MQKEILDHTRLNFDDILYEKCEKFISILKQWGSTHNLTSSINHQDILDNIIDSIYPLKFLKDFSNFADIGTGCGYPGLILAIFNPNIKATLIEPRIKQVSFLNFIKNSLDLQNVTIIDQKVENISQNIKYDLITSRAVKNTKLLLNISKNIIKPSTKLLFYKGTMIKDELKDISSIKDYEIITTNNSKSNRNYLYIKSLKLKQKDITL
jgi:16S rRNA (guanine527-N7)-methyltransferase